MQARAVNIQFKLGKIDEASRIVKDSIVPAMKGQKGFKGQLLLTQPDTGKAVSINLWETEADMTTGEGSGYYREQVAKVAHTLAGSPAREAYKVNNRE